VGAVFCGFVAVSIQSHCFMNLNGSMIYTGEENGR
jgi:hypothetical protein